MLFQPLDRIIVTKSSRICRPDSEGYILAPPFNVHRAYNTQCIYILFYKIGKNGKPRLKPVPVKIEIVNYDKTWKASKIKTLLQWDERFINDSLIKQGYSVKSYQIDTEIKYLPLPRNMMHLSNVEFFGYIYATALQAAFLNKYAEIAAKYNNAPKRIMQMNRQVIDQSITSIYEHFYKLLRDKHLYEDFISNFKVHPQKAKKETLINFVKLYGISGYIALRYLYNIDESKQLEEVFRCFEDINVRKVLLENILWLLSSFTPAFKTIMKYSNETFSTFISCLVDKICNIMNDPSSFLQNCRNLNSGEFDENNLQSIFKRTKRLELSPKTIFGINQSPSSEWVKTI